MALDVAERVDFMENGRIVATADGRRRCAATAACIDRYLGL